MTITFIFRSTGTGHSIEGQFDAVCQAIERCCECCVKRVQLPCIGRNWRTIWRNVQVARQAARETDVVHITGDVHYIALGIARKKTVLTIHDCITLEKNRQRPLRFAFFWLFWYYLPVRWAMVVTVVSDKTRQELIRYVGRVAEKTIVIPNSYHPLFTRQSASFRTNCPVLLQLGTAPHKNLDRLVAAIEGISCKLLIVGPLTADQLADLSQREIQYEQYIDLSQQDVIDLYQRCDLVTFTSTYEGFGLPILEANAVGRAVVTANRSPMREVAGPAASLVDPLDVASIRAGILRIIQDERYRENLIQAGYTNAQRYAIDTTASQYLAAYRLALRKEPLTGVAV